MSDAAYLGQLAELLAPRGDLRVVLRREIDSTNRAVKELLRADPDGPALAAAEVQTAGRGRLGRSWQSPAGNLYISFGYPCGWPAEQSGAVTLAAALAVADALEAAGADCGIKWPNDIYAGRHKLAGILCEGVTIGGAVRAVVVGVGVNVAQRAFPPEIAPRATSLALLGKDQPRAPLAHALLCRMDERIAQFARGGFAALRGEYTARSVLVGRPVQAAAAAGRCVGFSEEGDLLLDTGRGVLPVRYGEVTEKLRVSWDAAT